MRTLSLVFILVFAVSCSPETLPHSSPPNIILVFIDDMGWADLSSFGNTDAQTPAIDRMAAEGLAFEQFYVNSPICSPSRIAISTGQYPQRWQITSYLSNRKHNQERGIASWLDPDAPMLARTLQDAGYATGHFGKWHMGGQRDVDDAPPITEYGFDASLTNFEGIGAKLLPLTMEPGATEPGRIWEDAERLGDPVIWMQRSRITEGFVDAAIVFMQEAVRTPKPFYINLWPDDVHSPFFPPVEHWGETKREKYLAVLEAMDRQLDPLFEYVRSDKSIRENTIILICSDNGHELDAGTGGPLKGAKTHLFEGGIRSPLIAWGPGFISKAVTGTRDTSSVFAAFDLVPSLLSLADVSKPAKIEYDGEDVLSTLLGTASVSRQAPLFFSRPPDRKNYYGFTDLPDLAVRYGQWKFLCDYDGSRPLLYNILHDPGESINLVDQEPEVVDELRTLVVGWYESILSAGV